MSEAKYVGVRQGDMGEVPLDGHMTEATADVCLLEEEVPHSVTKRPSGIKKYLQAVWAVLECMFFGGLVYGWGSLVFVLKKEGIYADLCLEAGADNSSNMSSIFSPNNTGPSDSGSGCTAQDEKLNLAFTVGTLLMTCSSPLMGHLQYKFGTRMARIVLSIFFLFGGLCIALMTTATPWLVYIGLSFIAIGGLPVLVTNIQVANLFAVGGSTVVGLLSGSFDASASVQLMVKIAYENGISRMYSYFFICALHSMVIFSTFFLLPKMFIPKAEPITGQVMTKTSDPAKEKVNGSVQVTEGNRRLASDSDERELTEAALPSLKDCALSRIFLSHVMWLSILQLRFYFFIGTLNTWLNYVTNRDQEQVSYHTNVSLFIQLGGIVTALICGIFLDGERKRNQGKPTITQRRLQPSVFPQAVTSLLALVLSALVLVPSTQVLYVIFIVLTVFRSFMYGLAAAFVQMIFPAEYFGFLYGVMIVISGLMACLQYPLFIWMETPPTGPTKVNIFLLVLMFISLIHPVHIWLTCRSSANKSSKEKDKQAAESEYIFINKCCKCL